MRIITTQDYSAIAVNAAKSAFSSLATFRVVQEIEKQVNSSFSKGGFSFKALEQAAPRTLGGKEIALKDSISKLEKIPLFDSKFDAQLKFETAKGLKPAGKMDYYNALLIREPGTNKVTGYYLEKVRASVFIPNGTEPKETYSGPFKMQP